MTDRKKPGVAFWITVALVAVLVGYPLSYGPVGWFCERPICPTWFQNVADRFYDPLMWTLRLAPVTVQNAWTNYVLIFFTP